MNLPVLSVVMFLFTALTGIATATAGPAEALLDARTRAYNANFRNDAPGMKRAVADFERLSQDAKVRPYALYYAAWTEWVLTASYYEAQDQPAAIATIRSAVAHARAAAEARPEDADFQCMLANSMIGLAVMDTSQMREIFPQVVPVRRKAVELGPANPRVLIMDAGVIFHTPPERGGSQEKALEQWRRAMELFEREAASKPADALMPRWGRAEAYGWFASMYLAATPPQTEAARKAAARALELRPDYWWVKERVMPKLKS